MATAAASADNTGELAPAWVPDERQLADLELLLSGAFAPLTGFMSEADAESVTAKGRLADGTPFPIPVTLEVPADAAVASARTVELTDPEGTPLAILRVAERTPLNGTGLVRLAGAVAPVKAPEHGAFRRLMLTPVQAREALGDKPVLGYPTRAPLHRRHIGQLRHLAGQRGARILLLPLVGGRSEVVARPDSLVRAVLAAATSLPSDTLVVPVPLAPRATPTRSGVFAEAAARAWVAAAYGATLLMTDGPADLGEAAPIAVISSGDWAYDPDAEVWRPLSLIEPGRERPALSDDELTELLDDGRQVPDWFTPAEVARELRRARLPRAERGLVLFLTGLSGSGKSTLARDLADVLAERGDRRVSLLDGDHVRRLLSAGLGFSRADRDLNIERIGFVAAEVARHGGIAICAPIAPFALARARARAIARDAGDFFLIHVATPIEVCEQRDRKGLYAKARSGLIGQFTGVSDPYEVPTDAELVIDTSVLSRPEAVGAVLRMLTMGGWLT